MAEFDRYIHELPAASTVGDNDLFAMEQGGEAMRLTWALLRTFINRNVLHVVTTPVSGATAITSDFDVQTGTLTFSVPAQLIDAYTKAETDQAISSAYIDADHVRVSPTQTLADLLLYDEDLRKYLPMRSMSRASFSAMVLAGAQQQDTMYFPRDYVGPAGGEDE